MSKTHVHTRQEWWLVRYGSIALPLLVLGVGIVLRFTDLLWPDVLSDEGLFLFPDVHSHPTLVYWSFFLTKAIFGPHLLVARLTNVTLGLLSLVVFFIIARTYVPKITALWVAAVAAIVPYHILFSRVFELDIGVQLSWLLVILTFIEARKNPNTLRIVLLFIACVAATFTKTQSCLLHLVLLLSLLIEKRQHIFRDDCAWIIGLSLIPFGVYILAHPSIPATALHITGNDPLLYPTKFIALMRGAYYHQGLWVVAFLLCLPALRRYPWPITALCAAGVAVPLLLGPHNEYYMSYYVFLAFPIGATLAHAPRLLRYAGATFLVAVTLFLVGSIPGYSRDWYEHMYRRPLYWNTHMDLINAVLHEAGVKEVTVLGGSGHQFRWYFDAEVRPGYTMNPEEMRGTIVITNFEKGVIFSGATVLYEDDMLKIVQTD